MLQKKGVGGIGEAIRYPPPPGLVPGGNGVVDAPPSLQELPDQGLVP